MLPHPITSSKIAERRLQEQLRDTAQQRRAASAETAMRSRLTTGWSARLAVITWVAGLGMRLLGATRVLATDPSGRDSARSVHPLA